VIPLTPGGIGVVEAALVTVSVSFGAPQAAAVVAILGYRLVNFWLPLPVGLAAYVRVRAKAPIHIPPGRPSRPVLGGSGAARRVEAKMPRIREPA
jgi:hypothetical protein